PFRPPPALLPFNIFDRKPRLSVLVTPATKIARQFTLPAPAPAADSNPDSLYSADKPPADGEDLGTQVMENVVAHGVRKTRTVPATASGTGKPVIVTDEYWYSDELHLNMLVKHDDPRSGQKTSSDTLLVRAERPGSGF